MFAQFVLTAILASTAIAAPAPASSNQQRAVGDHFSLIALRSTSPVHLQSVNANGASEDLGRSIYVGRNTTTYCPAEVVDCSYTSANQTVLTAGSDGRLALDTVVPGGQTVYIDKFGVLRYTEAHSGVIPDGSVLDGWTYTPPSSAGSVGSLTHGTDEILACSAQGDGYVIFVKIGPISIPEDCISFNLGAYPYEGLPAWQYE